MGIYFQHSIINFYSGDAHNEKLAFFYQGSENFLCLEITFSFIVFQVQHIKCGEFLRARDQ